MPTHHARIHRLAVFDRMLLSEWRKLKLPTVGDTIVVAVSGGADSTALLLSIAELIRAGKLQLAVCVAHLDHGLRAESKKDAQWVRQLAKKLGFVAVVGRGKVAVKAREESDNLEQAARNARYEFLERTAKKHKAEIVLSGHTMDDQAETVLLRLMRGSAGFGLSGMESIRPIGTGSSVSLIRPILWARRGQTEDYCRLRKIDFLTDEMNLNERFARVKVRKQLVPLMESFNNKVVEALSRTASLLREDDAFLVENATQLLEKAAQIPPKVNENKVPRLSVSILANAPAALRRRALRKWISLGRGSSRKLEMVHLLAVEKLLEGDKGGRVAELPNGSSVRRQRGWLEFLGKND
jgi:tRNA(Ile)-lysidine synthase